MASVLTRRSLLQGAALASGAIALGPSFWRRAVTSAATPTTGPYGPLGPPDANGLRLPAGFRSRLVARGAELVPGTAYRFPVQPDGQAVFGTRDGGWILVTNSEAPPPEGGVSATRFDASGALVDSYRILAGTAMNCSGGPTPWGTWLSCEETDAGLVWECDPTQPSQGRPQPALGTFKHEAVAVDSAGQRLYLTEDVADGNLYRFTPDDYPVLDSGVLEAAIVGGGGRVTWARVPNPNPRPDQTPTRRQVPGATTFARAEGIWFDSGVVYVATTADSRIHAYDTVAGTIEVVYDKARLANPPLTEPDNITVSPSGDLFVAENSDGSDGGIDIALLTPDLTISRFLIATGPKHLYDNPVLGPTELTGPAFDPSGTRLYLTSQRARTVAVGDAPGPGEVYEITGPFRLQRPAGGCPNPREPGQCVGSGQGAGCNGAALGVEVPRRIAAGTLLARGLPVRLTLDEPASVTVAVRARFRPLSARARGRRRRTHRLGRAQRTYPGRGPRTLRTTLDRRGRALLRGRRGSLRLAVEVTVTDRDGCRRRFVRSTVMTVARARAPRFAG